MGWNSHWSISTPEQVVYGTDEDSEKQRRDAAPQGFVVVGERENPESQHLAPRPCLVFASFLPLLLFPHVKDERFHQATLFPQCPLPILWWLHFIRSITFECYWTCVYVRMCRLGPIWLFATSWTVAHEAPLSIGFSRQEHWSGLQFPPPGDLPDPGINRLCVLCFLCWQAGSLPFHQLILIFFFNCNMCPSAPISFNFSHFVTAKREEENSDALTFSLNAGAGLLPLMTISRKKKEIEVLEEGARELLSHFNHQNTDALLKVTRNTLEAIRRRIQFCNMTSFRGNGPTGFASWLAKPGLWLCVRVCVFLLNLNNQNPHHFCSASLYIYIIWTWIIPAVW